MIGRMSDSNFNTITIPEGLLIIIWSPILSFILLLSHSSISSIVDRSSVRFNPLNPERRSAVWRYKNQFKPSESLPTVLGPIYSQPHSCWFNKYSRMHSILQYPSWQRNDGYGEIVMYSYPSLTFTPRSGREPLDMSSDLESIFRVLRLPWTNQHPISFYHLNTLHGIPSHMIKSYYVSAFNPHRAISETGLVPPQS